MDDWKAHGGNGLTFPQQVSNFFHGPEQMLCADTSARDGCSSYVECDNVNHPAGMFILNSFVAMSNVSAPSSGSDLLKHIVDLCQLNFNMYDAISKAESAVTTQMGGFASTFAPIEDGSEGLKLALDLLGLGFAMFMSPMWNSGRQHSASNHFAFDV